MPRYVWDRTTGTFNKVADKVPSKGSAESVINKPFAQQVLEGYRNAHQRGHTRGGWRASTIKRVWGSA